MKSARPAGAAAARARSVLRTVRAQKGARYSERQASRSKRVCGKEGAQDHDVCGVVGR